MSIASKLFFRKGQTNYVIGLRAVNDVNNADDVVIDLNDQIDHLGLAFKQGRPLTIFWRDEAGVAIPDTDPRIIQMPISWSAYKQATAGGRSDMVKNTIIPKILNLELPVINWV